MKKSTYILLIIFMVLFASFSWGTTSYGRLTELEILKGDEEGLRLDDFVTRKELAVIIARLMGESSYAENYPVKSIFEDVEDTYYSSYISWAYSKGFFNYISGSKFNPDKHVDDMEFERAVLKILGYEVPERYIKYKSKELDIDISVTEEVTRDMMVNSLSKALDIKINGRNISIYENLIEQKINKSDNKILNLEVLSLKKMIVEFSKSVSTQEIGVEVVEKSNPFKKTNLKQVEYLGSNRYLISVGRMESDEEYYLKYDGVSYPFSPKKNVESELNIKSVDVVDTDKVFVEFSERVTPESANNVSNYGVDGVTIKSVKVNANLRSAIVNTEKLTNNAYYNLHVKNIEGLNGSEMEREEFIIVGYMDVDKPHLVSGELKSNDILEIVLSDNSGIDKSTALNKRNYLIYGEDGNVKIGDIVVLNDDKEGNFRIYIKTNTEMKEENYNIEISNIKDNSNRKNVIDKIVFSLVQKNIDIKGPEILKVEALEKNKISLQIFDENQLDIKSVFNARNYHVNNNIQITNIYLATDRFKANKNVTSLIIETTNMSKSTNYSIKLENIIDEYGNNIAKNEIDFESKVIDNVSPKVVDISVIDKNTIGIRFDEKINRVNFLNTENYVIDNLVGNPNLVLYDEKEDRLLLKVSDLKKGVEYLLSVQNILDNNMNEMGTKSYSFVYSFLNTDYFIKKVEFLNSNLIKVNFNSNVENTNNLNIKFIDLESNGTVDCSGLWYREQDKSVVYFKSNQPLKSKKGYLLESVSGLFLDKAIDHKLYFNDSTIENNKILGYKILGNNEIVVFLKHPFYIKEDEVGSNIIDYSFSKKFNSINLKFDSVFESEVLYLDLRFVKNISERSFYNPNNYSGKHKFMVNFKSVNPIDYVEVYNYYNLSIFHETPVFGKYYKVFNESDSEEIDLINISVDENNSKKVNILINDRLEENDNYVVKVYNDSQFINESDSENFMTDFDQYLIAKVVDKDSIEIYADYVNEYNVSLYKVDSNYKKIGNNITGNIKKQDSKFIVETNIELLNGSNYLLDYGNGQIYLKGKAATIDSQIFVVADAQYTGKLTVSKEFEKDEDKKYSGRLFKVDTMEEIKIFDGVDNQYLIKEPINIGDEMLFRIFEGDDLIYSSEIVVKDGIKDYYQSYFHKINSFNPENIIDELIDLSKNTAYFSEEDIRKENALYYIDNLKINNEYTIYELYSIIKGVNKYYGSREKEEIETLLMNLENFTYTLDDDMTIAYSLSNYGAVAKEVRKKIESLPDEEKSEYISRVDNIEKKIIDSVTISKIVIGREKMLNKLDNSTYFTPRFLNKKGIVIDMSLNKDGVEIDYEWEVLKFEVDKYTYSRDIENISVQTDGDGVSLIINNEEATEGLYKIKLKIEEKIFEKVILEILGEGELIIQ